MLRGSSLVRLEFIAMANSYFLIILLFWLWYKYSGLRQVLIVTRKNY